MSVAAGRRLFVVFFALYTVALTYPGVLPFNRIHPFVFGLPFSMFWVMLWVVLGFVVFLAVDRVEAAAGTEPEED